MHREAVHRISATILDKNTNCPRQPGFQRGRRKRPKGKRLRDFTPLEVNFENLPPLECDADFEREKFGTNSTSASMPKPNAEPEAAPLAGDKEGDWRPVKTKSKLKQPLTPTLTLKNT